MTEPERFTAEALWVAGHTVVAIAEALGVSRGAVSGHITRSALPVRSKMTADDRRDHLLRMKANRRDGGLLNGFDWIARYAQIKTKKVKS